LGISPRLPHGSHAYAGFVLCVLAAGGALGDPPAETPTGSFLSSLKQAINKDSDHEVVRGHFDVGTPPDAHRYFCLVDAKTGKGETNGVAGQPFVRADGMTGVKGGAVSFYSCANAERQGILVTSGYVLSGAAGSASAPPSQTKRPADVTAVQSVPPEMNAPPDMVASPDKSAPPGNGVSDDSIDVAGLRLGMSPEQVRAVLKSKRLFDYYESAQNLSDDPAVGMQLSAAGRFVNTMAAWTSASPAGGASTADGEAYEVMFTPVPGKERAMSIVHSMSYSSENAVREMTVDSGLVKKFGGYTLPDLPGSPTWRMQRGGGVLVGDSCNRRAIVGGLRELDVGVRSRPNLALKTTPEEFQYQVDHCGVAIVTEDHTTANGGAPRQDRTIARLTVTAYSPSIGLDGATAAMQLMQTARNAVDKSKVPRIKERPAPDL
jgi:hypothetical protein